MGQFLRIGGIRAMGAAEVGSLAKRTLWAAVAFILHGTLIAVVLGMVKGVELLFHVLWPAAGPLLFDRVPLNWLLNAVDAVAFLLFGTFGLYEAFQQLRGK